MVIAYDNHLREELALFSDCLLLSLNAYPNRTAMIRAHIKAAVAAEIAVTWFLLVSLFDRIVTSGCLV